MNQYCQNSENNTTNNQQNNFQKEQDDFNKNHKNEIFDLHKVEHPEVLDI